MLLEELIHERENGERYIESYELHEYLQVKTAHNVWINNRVKKCGFNEYRDYILVDKILLTNNPKNPTTKIKNYEMTLRMAEHLCMIENNDMGKKARDYFVDCETYIDSSKQTTEFNYWRLTGKVLRKGFTDIIKSELNPNNQFVYSNYTDLIYKKIFGKRAKDIKEEKGLGKNDNLRDNLTPEELEKVSEWETKVQAMIQTFKLMGMENSEIFQKIKELLKL